MICSGPIPVDAFGVFCQLVHVDDMGERPEFVHGGESPAAFDPCLEADQEPDRKRKEDDIVKTRFDGLNQFNEPDVLRFGAPQAIHDEANE